MSNLRHRCLTLNIHVIETLCAMPRYCPPREWVSDWVAKGLFWRLAVFLLLPRQTNGEGRQQDGGRWTRHWERGCRGQGIDRYTRSLLHSFCPKLKSNLTDYFFGKSNPELETRAAHIPILIDCLLVVAKLQTLRVVLCFLLHNAKTNLRSASASSFL